MNKQKKKPMPNARFTNRHHEKMNRIEKGKTCIWDVFDEEYKAQRRFDEKLRNAKATR